MNFNFTRSIAGILAFLLFSVASQANNSYKLSKPKEGKPSEQFSKYAAESSRWGRIIRNESVDTFVVVSSKSMCVNTTYSFSGGQTSFSYWKSQDSSIASVDSLNGNIFSKKKGLVNIYEIYPLSNDTFCFQIIVTTKTLISPIKGLDSICLNYPILFTDSSVGGVWINMDTTVGTLNTNGYFFPIKVGIDTIKYVYYDSSGCIDTVIKFVSVSTSACSTNNSNISFENNNFINWIAETGTVSATSNSIYTFTTIGVSPVLHKITSANTLPKLDPYGKFPVYYGGSAGKYSVKLNDSSCGAKAVGINYTISIPSGQNNYALKYYYAVVLEDPQHDPWNQPGFNVQIWDLGTNPNSTNKVLLRCDTAHYTSTNVIGMPGWKTSSIITPSGSPVYYCPWTPMSLNLKNLAGHQVRLEFTAHDCIFGGHFGYAYLDFDTTFFINKTNTARDLLIGVDYCKDGSNIKITAPSGYKNYVWYDSSFNHIIANSVANNVLTYTTTPVADTMYYNLLLKPYKGFGCLDTISFKLVGHDLPIVGPITGNNIVCRGNRTLLTDTSLGSFSPTGAGIWLPYNPANITIENTSVGYTGGMPSSSQATVKIAQAGITDSLKYVVTNMYGCMGSANYTITKPPVNTNNYNLSGCSSVVLNGVSYTSSAIVNDTLLTQSGCDSLYNVSTINVIPVVAVVQNAVKDGCNTVVYNGLTYSNSTYLRDTVRSMQGCDSIYHVIHILVNTPAPPTVNIVASSTTATTGTPVTFVANASNVGTTVNYQFMVNHTVVQNSASDSFTTATLVNNDTVFCIVTTTSSCGTFTSTSDTVVMNITPLPLSLLSFEGNLQGKNAHLNWLTTAEINTSHFILQRSTDGKTFKDVAKVQAQGESNKQHQYSYTDYTVTELANAPVLYYRIKMFDKDGNFSTSKTIAIKITSQSELFVYPNPVKNRLNVTIQPSKEQVCNMMITDVQGKLISEQSIKLNQGINKFEINTTNLLRGNYILIFKGTEGVRYAKFTRE